MADSLAIQ